MPKPVVQVAAPNLPPRRGFWVKVAASKFLFVSIAVHLLFIGGATYYVVQSIQAKRKLQFAAGPPVSNPSKRALEHKVSMAKKTKTMSAPAQAKRITTTGLSRVALPDMPAMTTGADVIPNRMAGMGGIGQGFGISGSGGMGGGGGGSGINFFGLRAKARDIVFVVDISGSMVTNPKSPKDYEVLEKEVIKVIKGLDPLSRFGIVTFSAGADAYKENLVSARNDEKERAINWLKKMNPAEYLDPKASDEVKARHRGTRAHLGLEKAFALKPDTIFFVSDGDPSGATREEILDQVAGAQKNLSRAAAVHAIAFMADGGEQFMKDLASRNSGTFREVKGK